MRNIFRLITVFSICLCSCSPESENDPPAPEPDFVRFQDSATTLTAPAQGGDVIISFSTNKEWKLEMIVNNATQNGQPAQYKGEAGEQKIIFTAKPNTGMTSRSTLIKITAGRASGQITIQQDVMLINLPGEDEVRAYLMRLFNDTDGPNWRFKSNWGSDLPLNRWEAVKYENGRLELFLGEHYLKGKINLSGCKALVSLRCAKNQITEIDVSDCPLLQNIDCTNTGLERINLTGCLSLQNVSAGYNNLESIDIGWCTTLSDLYVNDCRLTELDLSRCVSLQDLACYRNRLTRLEIPHRHQLKSIWCYENELASLDISNSPLFELVNCGDNELTEFRFSDCPRLDMIYCYNNRLKEIDTSQLKEVLTCLYCYSNKLTEMDMSGYRKLSELHCSDNDIAYIDITGCKSLRHLYCSYNKIEKLEFNGIDTHIFERLDCSYNRLREIDLSPLTYLIRLWCQGNRIGGEIPERYDRLLDFGHDARYEYRPDTGTYTDRGYGWWYPGEPQKMSHTR